MTFTFEKDRMTAFSQEGKPMGYITFPQIRCGLVNISQVITYPAFRGQGVAEAMMDALLPHLISKQQKAALTSTFAQQYALSHSQWKHILPEEIHFTKH